MSSQQQFDNPFGDTDSGQPPAGNKAGLSAGKKAALAVGGIVALGASFAVGGFVGAEIGYDNARTDIAAEEAIGNDSAQADTAAEVAVESAAPDSASNGDSAGNNLPDVESSYPVALSVGDSVEVPCAMYALEEGTCMTLTLTDFEPNAACTNPYKEADRYVALSFDASMPSDADEDFVSPFIAGSWSVVNDNNQITRVSTEFGCDLSNFDYDLLDEFPGYSASGTFWLPVEESATEAHLKVFSDTLLTIAI